MDEVGNTLSDKAGKREYTYNERNQLATFTKDTQLRATYQYNANNQRTSKHFYKKLQEGQTEADSHTFHYQYDLFGNLVGEYKTNASGVYKPKRSYIWLNNEPIAQITYKFNSSADVKHITYITTDHLNTPRIGTDETQTIAWRWDSDAFGQAQPNKDPNGNDNKRNIRLRFAGQYKDSESGLYYNWNRYYDPNVGRYVTSDPIGLSGGLNTYLYANANSNRYFDPEGLIGIVGALGGSGGLIGGGGAIGGTNGTGTLGEPVRPLLPANLPEALCVGVLGVSGCSTIFPPDTPAANDDEFCPQMDNDDCKFNQAVLKEQYEGLKKLASNSGILQSQFLALFAAMQAYNKLAKSHNKICKKYPVPLFSLSNLLSGG